MDLDFTPEQDLLREAVRGVCAKHQALQRAFRHPSFPNREWTSRLGMTLARSSPQCRDGKRRCSYRATDTRARQRAKAQ